jgi:hypothetical protein
MHSYWVGCAYCKWIFNKPNTMRYHMIHCLKKEKDIT